MGQNAEILYRSTPQTDAAAKSSEKRLFPLPPHSPVRLGAYAFDREFECVLDGVFPPKPFNTPANDAAFGLADANAILTDYSQPNPSGAGMGAWNARFTIVPASWDDFTETFSYLFPAFHGNLNLSNGGGGNIFQVGRFALQSAVISRLHYDYFVLDPANICAGIKDSNGNDITRVATADLIPNINRTMFIGLANPTFSDGAITDSGGTSEGSTFWMETKPTKQLYAAWMANALKPRAEGGGWSSTVYDSTRLNVADTTDGQIIAEDSRNVPYAGNIIARVTRYVLAQ
jgi:hypothetical protein